ncbi:MAG: leucine-rich repeat protein [Holosporales bacterium]|jgi:serine/threonine protein kinase|nr:leucine-rich repeat protein [Holosporales bacterium]
MQHGLFIRKSLLALSVLGFLCGSGEGEAMLAPTDLKRAISIDQIRDFALLVSGSRSISVDIKTLKEMTEWENEIDTDTCGYVDPQLFLVSCQEGAEYIIKARHVASGRDECGDAQRVSGILSKVSPLPPQLRIILPEYFCVVSDGTPSSALPISAYKSESVKEGDITLQWMPKAPGSSLWEHIGEFPTNKVQQVLFRTAEGLRSLHNLCITHGDSHLSNVFFDEKSDMMTLIDCDRMEEGVHYLCVQDEDIYKPFVYSTGVERWFGFAKDSNGIVIDGRFNDFCIFASCLARYSNVVSFFKGYGGCIGTLSISSTTEKLEGEDYRYQAVDTICFGKDFKAREIGSGVFEGCVVHSITIPRSVQNLCEESFKCAFIQKFSFETRSQLTTINRRAFHASCIDFFTIPSRVASIEWRAFEKARVGTLSFEGGSQLTKIMDWTFTESHIDSLAIPSRVASIGQGAFWKARVGTLSFEGGSQLTKIMDWAFTESHIGPLTIPSSVASIGQYAFEKARVGTLSFEGGSQLTKIMDRTFTESHIDSLAIPSSVASIEWRVFEKARVGTLSFEGGSQLTKIMDRTFTESHIDSLAIPSSVASIGQSAFKGAEVGTLSFEGGSQLQEIGENCFNGSEIQFLCLHQEDARLEGMIRGKGARIEKVQILPPLEADSE